jgi:hypothetical protein
MKKVLLIILISAVFIFRCDGGIEPEPVKSDGPTGFKGAVTFTGNWPAGVKRTHLVVFKKPIQKTDDFFPPNLSFVSDSIPYGSLAFNYNSLENNFLPILQLGEGTYSYVVVAQSKTEEISFERKDWYVVGVYCNNGDQASPKELILRPGEITEGVNIKVDFNNPPPQPPY